ncbi:hypothetical protein CAPTEDRAFT_172225 [Capitella teleta]|uniref:[histone H4]-lysine(20) N-methyltransferase n=1 Tax=Capitella teleta TaxID=283909 RepID=X1ZCN7_CAPTE|nr:hypothetical protein CAPTEDRAFT_172225 [Capitella teleta]|eukprot:ELT88427.1 hypothetical protein CAPTEDRAFT_172225 [Capitella teleta]
MADILTQGTHREKFYRPSSPHDLSCKETITTEESPVKVERKPVICRSDDVERGGLKLTIRMTTQTQPKPKVKGKRRKAQNADAKPKLPKASSRSKSTKTHSKDQSKSCQSHLMTDFFPVRRSNRMTAAMMKKEKQSSLEEAILQKREEGLEVVEFVGKGRGVVACKPFRRGDFVVEYAGDLVDLKTARNRETEYNKNPDIGCYMYYFRCGNQTYCVDATAESGRLGRLLNHSRHGNCATKPVVIADRPYLILVAKQDIEEGEELLYDYGDRSAESLRAHPWLNL